jgi:hypothetical protein
VRVKVPAVVTLLAMVAMTGAARGNHSIIEVGSANSAGQAVSLSPFAPDATPDGMALFFNTPTQVVAADTDTETDVYMRTSAGTTLMTPGTSHPAVYLSSTPNGANVLFATADRLTPDDLDNEIDMYRRSGGVTTLISTGPAGGNGPIPVCEKTTTVQLPCPWQMSDDGARVFFITRESLVLEDTDGSFDIYERSGTTTTLVSTGSAGGNGPIDVGWDSSLRITGDGTHAFFRTTEALVPEDTDTSVDLYERTAGTTRLVSTGPQMPGCGSSGCTVDSSYGFTADGNHVFFETNERLVAADTNNATDVYERSGGVTTLHSVGAAGTAVGGVAARFTPDGSHVYFHTQTQATPDDTDTATDGYEHFAATTTLVTSSPTRTCAVPLGYEYQCAAFVSSFTDDGSHVLFTTREKLVPEDTDFCPAEDPSEDPNLPCTDVYERVGGVTRLVSTGPNETPTSKDAFYAGASKDLTRIFFGTDAKETPDDLDTSRDAYERYAGALTLVTGGFPGFVSTFDLSDDGTRMYFTTSAPLVGDDTNALNDAYLSRVAGPNYPRPKGATPIFASLVPAYANCPTPNRQHGPPLAFGSCAPPQRASSQLTVGTPDANSQPAKSVGSVSLYVIAGDPATPADEADVLIDSDITDVRLASGLGDYTGSLQARIGLRLTDRAGADPQTLTNTTLSVPVSCASTPDTTIGAHCATTTTADAVVPGIVPERARSLWQLDQITVLDGTGAPFAVQGLFVP